MTSNFQLIFASTLSGQNPSNEPIKLATALPWLPPQAISVVRDAGQQPNGSIVEFGIGASARIWLQGETDMFLAAQDPFGSASVHEAAIN